MVINALHFGIELVNIEQNELIMSGNFALKLFIVDNDLFSLAMYEQHLRNMKCTDVTCFDNENSCLNKLHEMPKIILLDYRTNAAKGLTVLKQIKNINPDLYVVFITGPSSVITADKSLDYGALDFIVRDENYIEKLQKILVRIHQIDKLVHEPAAVNDAIL